MEFESFFPRKRFHRILIHTYTDSLDSGISVMCLPLNFNKNALSIYVIYTQTYVQVCICAWVCSKANRMREAMWFTLL